MTDLYADLGIPRDATAEQIKKAYRNLAKKHHPDAGGDATRFAALTRAYYVLMNPGKRQQYDETGQIDDKADSGDALAMSRLIETLGEVMGKFHTQGVDLHTVDLVGEMKAVLRGKKREYDEARKPILEGIETYKKVIGRFKKKRDADPMFDNLINGSIRTLEQMLEKKAEAWAPFERALEMLDGWSYEHKKRQAGPGMNTIFFDVGGFGGGSTGTR